MKTKYNIGDWVSYDVGAGMDVGRVVKIIIEPMQGVQYTLSNGACVLEKNLRSLVKFIEVDNEEK